MKYRFTILYFLLLSIAVVQAQPGPLHKGNNRSNNQLKKSESPEKSVSTSTNSTNQNNVTGIWKGYFVQNSLSFIEDKYRFEVQVAEQNNHSLTAVTYSYKTTVFYGKASATGIYTAKSKNFLLKELKLVDVKLTDKNSGACLMTCYLDFDKMGSLETLTGDYTSVSVKDKTDCGSGKIYLEKSPITDFYKEDFLVKRENELRNKNKSTAKKTADKKINPSNTTLATTKPGKIIKPGAEDNVVAKPKEQPQTVEEPKKEEPATAITPPKAKVLPKPEVMKTRDNQLLKTIVTSERDFKIELYDNGEVDGDRISVYHNNELIVSNKMLTDKPITFTIHSDENNTVHDFVMVAENMGTIPPNTSLMIITAGSQRYELFVTSTDLKNAVVRVEYKPNPESDNK